MDSKNSRKNSSNVSGGRDISSNNRFPSINENYDLKTGENEQGEIQRKTITRTFRLFQELSDSFDNEVAEMNTTQTNLMNEILKQYLYWSSLIINHESPFLTFDSSTFIALIESVDDARLEKIVKETATEAATDFIKFRWKKVNFRNIIRYLELLSSYSNIGNFRVAKMNGENGIGNNNSHQFPGNNNNLNVSGGYENYEIAVRYHLGKRWSTFLAVYISNLFTSSIKQTEASSEISNKSCFVYLKMGTVEGL
jgi:hypothetical protein